MKSLAKIILHHSRFGPITILCLQSALLEKWSFGCRNLISFISRAMQARIAASWPPPALLMAVRFEGTVFCAREDFLGQNSEVSSERYGK